MGVRMGVCSKAGAIPAFAAGTQSFIPAKKTLGKQMRQGSFAYATLPGKKRSMSHSAGKKIMVKGEKRIASRRT